MTTANEIILFIGTYEGTPVRFEYNGDRDRWEIITVADDYTPGGNIAAVAGYELDPEEIAEWCIARGWEPQGVQAWID